jgi:hypothetical protein
MEVDRPPKALIWNSASQPASGRKVSRIRNVSSIHSVTKAKLPVNKDEGDAKISGDDPPPTAQPSEGIAGPPRPAEEREPVIALPIPGIGEYALIRRPTPEDEYYGQQRTVSSRTAEDYELELATAKAAIPLGTSTNPHAVGIQLRASRDLWYRAYWPEEYNQWSNTPAQTATIRIREEDRRKAPEYMQNEETAQLTDAQWEQHYIEMLERYMHPQRHHDLVDMAYTRIPYVDDPQLVPKPEAEDTPIEQYSEYSWEGGRRKFQQVEVPIYVAQGLEQQGVILEEGEWTEDYNYIRPSESAFANAACREWYQHTHPSPDSLDRATQYWANRRRQLERCQTNEPNTYEA